MNKISSEIFFTALKLFIKTNKSFFALCVTILFSLIVSPYLIRINAVDGLLKLVADIIVSLGATNVIYSFVFSFLVGVLCIIPIFLNGLSVCGFALSYIYISVISAAIGTFTAYNYSMYGVVRIGYFLITYMPAAFIFIVGCVFAARESYTFSKMLCKAFTPGNAYNFSSDFKLYCARFLFILCIIMVSALVFSICAHFIKIQV